MLHKRDIAGDWLLQKLTEAGVSQTQLSNALGVSPPAVNRWVKGDDLIPRHHILSIAEVLRLDGGEIVELHRLLDIQEHVTRLRNLLGESPRRTQKVRIDDALCAFFDNPVEICDRLLERCESLAAVDVELSNSISVSAALRMHVMAAYRATADLEKYLCQDRDIDNLFTMSNIHYHLRYPTNHYIAFFMDTVTEADGPGVVDLQEDLLISLDTLAAYDRSERTVDGIIAQHSVHMITRHGTDEHVDRFSAMKYSKQIHTRRMALFGDAFRLSDSGNFLELCDTILRDDELSDAIISFDGLHYGDYQTYTKIPNSELVPMNSLVRHIRALVDKRQFIRYLSIVRISRILDRYESIISDNEELIDMIFDATERVRLTGFGDPDYRDVFDRLCRLADMTPRANGDTRNE